MVFDTSVVKIENQKYFFVECGPLRTTLHHQQFAPSRLLLSFGHLEWGLLPGLAMTERENTAPTLFLLMAQYGGKTVVPIDQVCRDFFGHLTVDKLLRKALRGDLALPIVRIETSQKAQRGVHLVDLAAYIDNRRAAAVKECQQLTGTM